MLILNCLWDSVSVRFSNIHILSQRGSTNKDACGSAEYKAGKADSSHKKGLAETGIVFSTCRHGVLWRAVDMDKGESYRHILYLHDFALKEKFKFFCYDVVCNYWPFAKDVGTKLTTEDFKKHTEEMIAFLSRFHGKTHSIWCQVTVYFKTYFIFYHFPNL